MSEPTEFAEPWWQHVRLSILRALIDTPGQGSHESLIVDMVNAVLVGADREHIRQGIVWLHENDLVVAEVKSGSLVAQITEAGINVAEGRRTVAGVKRPNVTAAVARQALTLSLDKLKR